MLDLRRTVLKGLVWTGVQKWVSQAITFALGVVLIRLLEPTAFGLVALASVFIAFAGLFVDQGMSDAIVQKADLQPEHLDTAFWATLSISAVMTVATIAAADVIAGFFREPQLAPVLRWLSLGFVFSGLNSTQHAILRRNLAFKKLATRTLLSSLVGGLVAVAMAWWGFGVWSLVGEQLVARSVNTFVLWRVSGWQPGLRVSRSHFGELFRFGLSVLGTNVLTIVNRRSDDFLIGYFLGTTALAYYNVAYRMLLMMTDLFIGVSSSVSFPTFSRLQDDPARARRAFYTATQYTGLVAFPAFVGMSVLAPELVYGVFGEKWAASIPVMRVLAYIGLLQSVFYFNATIITAMGKPSWRFGLALTNAIANLVAFSIAVRWGIVAVAQAYVIRGWLLSPLPLSAVHRLIGLDFKRYLSQYAAPLAGSAVMAVAVVAAKHLLNGAAPLLVLLPGYVLFGALVYAVTIFVAAPATSRQALSLARLALPLKAKPSTTPGQASKL